MGLSQSAPVEAMSHSRRFQAPEDKDAGDVSFKDQAMAPPKGLTQRPAETTPTPPKHSAHDKVKQNKTPEQAVEKRWKDSTIVSKLHQQQFSRMVRETERQAREQKTGSSQWSANSIEEHARKFKAQVVSNDNVLFCHG
jgi:hypothetical protein